MSEVIEDFIRRNPQMGEAEAFDAFLREPRIRTWVGESAERRERLQREFARVWSALQPPPPPSRMPPPAHVPHAGPAAPRAAVAAVQRMAPEPRPDPEPAAPRPRSAPAREGGARRLQLLCPSCARLDVWLEAGAISCHHCHAEYDDMLALVPVKPVGPFEYVFGEGTRGLLTAAGIAILLLAVYGVLKWV